MYVLALRKLIMTSNVNLDELSPLTPMVTPGGDSDRSIRSTGAGGSHWRNRLLIAGTALAFLSMAIWSQENATYRENVANQEDNHWLSMDRVSLWGSSKDKGHHHRHHVHQKPAKVSENLLQLKGYPPIDVQQQYLEDLAKIDFDKVKKDIALLLTESQDCKYHPHSRFPKKCMPMMAIEFQISCAPRTILQGCLRVLRFSLNSFI